MPLSWARTPADMHGWWPLDVHPLRRADQADLARHVFREAPLRGTRQSCWL
jgi:hypothetical protein